MVAGEMQRPITQVTGYRVSCLPSDHPDAREFTIGVEEREREDGEFWWAVTYQGGFFDIEGKRSWGFHWKNREPVGEAEMEDYERTRQEWLRAHRFTESEALALARRLASRMEYRGHTVADALAKTGREDPMTEDHPEERPEPVSEGLGALEGIQWTGENEEAVRGWLGDAFEKVRGGLTDGDPKVVWFHSGSGGSYLSWARPGDIIERRVDGTLHAYNPDDR
jgi:hypothetical protein